MPNGGITPDCIHCKNYRGGPLFDGEPFCEHHQVKLASPLRAFCSSFTDAEPSWGDWLGQELDRQQLQTNMMYVWFGGYEVEFFPVLLAPITEYGAWTSEKFYEEVRMLMDKYHAGT